MVLGSDAESRAVAAPVSPIRAAVTREIRESVLTITTSEAGPMAVENRTAKRVRSSRPRKCGERNRVAGKT
jgi:hypothetical protein